MKYGFYGLSYRIIKKLLTITVSIILLPLSIILFIFGFRRINFFIERIGHLAIEPEIFLKAQQLGLIKPKRWFVLAPNKLVANQHLLTYWKDFFPIYQGRLSCFFLHCLSLFPFMRYSVSHFVNIDNKAQFGFKVNRLWGNRPVLLTLSNEDREWSNVQLSKLGLPQDAWFTCLHVREGGFSPIDEELHTHRNGKIEHLIPTIKEITNRGGWVVRLGDPSMVPLKKMPQVIDYAHHHLRNARMDVVLCARARFIVGNTSGISLVGSIFGVPSALANMIPMPTLGFYQHDLSIPKFLFSKQKSKILSFKEVMQSEISTYRRASLYQEANIEVIENSPEDILYLVIEMLDRLEGRFIETINDQILHEKYMKLFTPSHYSYEAVSKVSFKFLNKYQHLLE